MADKRIFILGPPASGKSTLAARFAREQGLPRLELDRLYWDDESPGYGVRREAAERDRRLAEAVAQEAWVMDGVYYRWCGPIFERAEQILFLDVPLWTRQQRLVLRHLRRQLGWERGSKKESWASTWELMKWDRRWNRDNRPGAMQMLEPHLAKVRVVGSREAGSLG